MSRLAAVARTTSFPAIVAVFFPVLAVIAPKSTVIVLVAAGPGHCLRLYVTIHTSSAPGAREARCPTATNVARPAMAKALPHRPASR